MPRTFPLNAVLSFRQQTEDAEERSLTRLLAEVHQMHAALNQLDRELTQAAAGRQRQTGTVQSAAHHQASTGRVQALVNWKRELQQQLKQLELRRAEQQRRYLAARASREMLTSLREKHENAWRSEVDLRERKRVDDLFSARFARSAPATLAKGELR